MRYLLATAMMLLFGTHAFGAPTILGVGLHSCGRWTHSHDAALDGDATGKIEQLVYTAWMSGFISAFNIYVAPGGNTTGDQPMAAVTGWIDQYCTMHPLDNLSVAADRLLGELGRERNLR
jgi:hypothetical protein